MKNTRRIIGQILLVIGITLAIGGVESFMFEKVELRFLGNIITNETGRIIWVMSNALLACVGFIFGVPPKPKTVPLNPSFQ